MLINGLRLLAVVVVLLYLGACLVMYLFQRQLLFPADTRDIAMDVTALPRASVVDLTTADGETLRAWWVVPEDAGAPVYLYLHGNGGTLQSRSERLALLTAEGAGVLAVSWRGYGGSTGSPSETGLRHDAVAARDWLQRNASANPLIVFGESLGSGVALWLVSQYPAAALVLDSAYTAISDVAKQTYPWLPVALLSRDPFNSMAFAADIDVPTLAFHCTEDPVVPYWMGEQLLAALATPDKHLETIPGRCHVPGIEAILPLLRKLEADVRA